jgi:hypothetical protein
VDLDGGRRVKRLDDGLDDEHWRERLVPVVSGGGLDAGRAGHDPGNQLDHQRHRRTVRHAHHHAEQLGSDVGQRRLCGGQPRRTGLQHTAAVPIEEDVHDKSSATNYVAYYASQSAASPGSQTFGLTSPTGQTWSMVGIEILDVPGPGSPDDPNQVEPLKLWQ